MMAILVRTKRELNCSEDCNVMCTQTKHHSQCIRYGTPRYTAW